MVFRLLSGSLIYLVLILLAGCRTEDPMEAEKIAWLKDKAVPVRSVDPEDERYDDLLFLKEELAGVEIIGLGEQSHGDGSSFLAKARLMKFLREELGFSILAFESGMLDCALALKAYENGAPIDSAFRMGIFRVWSDSRQLDPVKEYLGRQPLPFSPLFIGFDSQYSGSLTPEGRRDSIYYFLKRHEPGLDTSHFPVAWKALALQSMKEYRKFKSDTLLQEQFFAQMDSLTRLVERFEPASLEDKLIAKGVADLSSFYYFMLHMNPNNPENDVLNIRDSIMAANVAWLKEEIFPERKIILWAANTHLGFNRRLLKYPDKMIPMGDYLKKRYGDKYYVLSFTSLEGRAGSLVGGVRNVPQSSNKTMEHMLGRTQIPFAWLRKQDLAAIPFEKPFQARLYGYTNWYADWPRMTDGIFFIREMTPNQFHR